jgi:hypothetical protein
MALAGSGKKPKVKYREKDIRIEGHTLLMGDCHENAIDVLGPWLCAGRVRKLRVCDRQCRATLLSPSVKVTDAFRGMVP